MRSTTSRRFRSLYAKLPVQVREQGRRAYRLWLADIKHHSLDFKPLNSDKTIYSARIGLHYRALGLRNLNAIEWFWIGTHAEYDDLIRRI